MNKELEKLSDYSPTIEKIVARAYRLGLERARELMENYLPKNEDCYPEIAIDLVSSLTEEIEKLN